MPTGYTSDIYEGKEISTKEFIMKCARAFGANISIREEGLDFDIPVYEPSDYHLKSIEKAKLSIEKLSTKTDEEIQKEIDDNYEKRLKENQEIIQKKVDLEKRYSKMLEEVRNWTPPTDEHVKLKEYAINQLLDSIYHDCDTKYYEQEIEKETVDEYRVSRMKYLTEDLERSIESHKKEIESVNKRNEWNRLLKESLV